MEIRVTARELMDRYLWIEACDEVGISEWAVNEGRMSMDDEITLTEEQAEKIGLLKR